MHVIILIWNNLLCLSNNSDDISFCLFVYLFIFINIYICYINIISYLIIQFFIVVLYIANLNIFCRFKIRIFLYV